MYRVPVHRISLEYIPTKIQKASPYFLDVQANLVMLMNLSVIIAACRTEVPIKMTKVCFMSFYRQIPTHLLIRIYHIGVQ